jgi:chemotaxis protein histidine kinase CheA
MFVRKEVYPTVNPLADLTQPRVHDRDSLNEFIDDLGDIVPKIEREVTLLRRTPDDGDLIADLFRNLHNIKGDASICKVFLGVSIAHPIESLLARMRAGEFRFTDLLAEVVLLAMDRLELAVEALAANRPVSNLKLQELVSGLERLAETTPADLDRRAVTLIEAVTGFRPAHATDLLPTPATTQAHPVDRAEDLRFFQALALQLEARSPLFVGRSARLLRLALDTNAAGGTPVDAAQLEAAVHMHDLGMMFLPESVWFKRGQLSDTDRAALHAHPSWGAGLLERMSGWQEAAQMVAQHHEMPDGAGYPSRLKDSEICDGAKILSIIDAFEAVTQKHSHRGQSRSLLRAIAEINACDKQFAPEWIGPFNTVIRRMLES